MKKHAYLIMAHNNFQVLEKLIRLLDYESNDIYIHVDIEAKDFDKEYFIGIPQKSNIYFINRMKVNWGGLSQVICELSLLERAKSPNYCYYHLLSGADLPIKSQKYIHDFFEKNEGKEFVGFVKNWDKSRIKYYHFFNEVGRNTDLNSRIKMLINRILIRIQKCIGVDRNKNTNFGKGTQWFSITHNLVEYIVERKSEILKIYNRTILCDEVFLQTLIINSNFKNNLYGDIFEDEYNNNLRYIDWNRGGPYVFRKSDFDELISSDKIFARKFDENIDFEIVNMLYEELS